MRRSPEDAEQTRLDILDTARGVFSRKGFKGARLEEIAQVAGVTRGAIYHYFGSKHGLYMAILENARSVGQETIDRAASEGGTFLEIVARVLVKGLGILEDDLAFREAMALSLNNQEVEGVAEHAYEEAETLVDTLAGHFRSAIAGGEVRPDLDPTEAARALLGFQNGLSLLWLANTKAFSIKRSAPALAEIYVRGIRAE